ncbi:MAG: type II toxin-antitoxin system prevent-host-death family antitoxin [Planctomycetaceae bacterium]
MLDLENGIESLTNFKRNTADYLQQLHQTGTPLVLTVNGRAEVVVQDDSSRSPLIFQVLTQPPPLTNGLSSRTLINE